jgi:hypothetical protein
MISTPTRPNPSSPNPAKRCSAMYMATALLWCAAGSLRAQDTPEMREILTRLDRLEKDNQALTEEIRALRQQLAATAQQPNAASTATSASTPAPTPEETAAVQQSRIDELSQTKVEASQKFPLSVTGMLLFNGFVNGRYNGNMGDPLVASLTPGAATGGGTVRQTTLGLLFNGPATFLGGKVTGSLYFDFYGGATSSLSQLARLRTADVTVDWGSTSLLVGQEKPLISPRDPDSLAQVGYAPLSGSGNLWLWQPQVRVEQRVSLGSDAGLTAQVGVFQTTTLDTPSDPYAYGQPAAVGPTENSDPGAEARLMLWRRWSDSGRLEIAGGFHVNRNHVAGFSIPSNIYSIDWFFRPINKIEFSGTYYHGRNAAVLGALQQGYMLLPGGNWVSVGGSGGWAQLRFPVTSRLAFDVYGGQEDDATADLLEGYVGKNQSYFANVMYRLAPNVMLSLEGGQVRTLYLAYGNRLNNHYDLGIAYLF